MNHNYFLSVKEVQILNMTPLIALKLSNYFYAVHALFYADCFWVPSHSSVSNSGICYCPYCMASEMDWHLLSCLLSNVKYYVAFLWLSGDSSR